MLNILNRLGHFPPTKKGPSFVSSLLNEHSILSTAPVCNKHNFREENELTRKFPCVILSNLKFSFRIHVSRYLSMIIQSSHSFVIHQILVLSSSLSFDDLKLFSDCNGFYFLRSSIQSHCNFKRHDWKIRLEWRIEISTSQLEHSKLYFIYTLSLCFELSIQVLQISQTSQCFDAF